MVEQRAPTAVVEQRAPTVVVEQRAPAMVVEQRAPGMVVEQRACERSAETRSAETRSAETRSAETRPGLLVVANGSATRTEKAPGHLDERAAAFDAAIGQALSAGDPAALADIDLDLADELWALPDADVLRTLAERVHAAVEVHVDYDDDPFGVQYWVVRWQCP